jgi:tetratricopeptide (TPR) repeat protein
MSKKIKSILYSGGGILVLGLLFLLAKSISDNKYRRQLTALPDMQNMSAPVREKISAAFITAKSNPTARNIGRLGMTFHSNSLYDKAAECYKLAIRKNRTKWVWNYFLGYLDREMGDNPGVIENFTEVVRKNPKDYLAWYYLGEGYQSIGTYDKAEIIYKKIMSDSKENASSLNSLHRDNFPLRTYAMFQIANIYLNTHKLDLAEKTLKEITENQKTFGQAYRLLGNVYSQNGDETLSKHYITRAGDLRIYTPPVDTLADNLSWMSCSDLYLLKQVDDADKGGYPNFALELVNTGMVNMPDNKFVISKALKLYLSRGMNNQALPYFDKHLQYFNDDINEVRTVADLCTKRGLYPQALKYYCQALKLLPDNIDIQLAIVLCLGNEGKKQEAVESMNKLVERNKETLKVLTNGMYIMILMGEKEKGLSYLKRLKELFPSNPKVLQLSGQALEQEGNNEKALALYEESFNRNPEDWATSRYLGDLLMKLKMWQRSISHYRKSLEYFPNDPYALDRLGTLLVMCPDTKLRNISEGREYSERAFINKSSPPLTVISSGRCLSESYAALGDTENAYKYLDTTISMARHENVSQDILDELQTDLQKYRK